MSKLKTSLKEPEVDNRLIDERGPTAERLKRSEWQIGDTGVISLAARQSPIERAVARGTISEQHGRAAGKFCHHWTRGGTASLGSNWMGELASFGDSEHIPMPGTEAEAFHRGQVRNAIAAIHSNLDQAGMSNDAISIMFLVLCDEVPFEAAGARIWTMNGTSAGALAVRYIRSVLRIWSIMWGIR